MNNLICRHSARRLESEVDEELSFHLQMLEQEYIHRGTSTANAQLAARRRFGEIDVVRGQCVAIARRRHPLNYILRSALLFMLVAGLFLRIFTAAPQFGRLADLSIAIAVLGHLFLYVRDLFPAQFAGELPRRTIPGKSS